MYIRKKAKTDPVTKKIYYTFQLIRSIRTEKGPRQEILLQLGNLSDLTDQELKQLANCIEETAYGSPSFIPYPDHIVRLAEPLARQLVNHLAAQIESSPHPEASEHYCNVDVNSLTQEHPRSIGMEHIAWSTFKKLELDKLLADLDFTPRQCEFAAASILSRLIFPGSERATCMWLQSNSGLGEVMDAQLTRFSPKSLYDISDRLLGKKEIIEEHLSNKEASLFSLDRTIVLYDLTNTYFEGRSLSSSLTQRGRSKEKRSDCPLVSLGLALDRQGFPLRSSTFEGNVSEPKTLQCAIETLNNNSEQRPVIVLDAGIATEENTSWLRENNYSYIVCSRSKKTPPEEELEIIHCTTRGVVKARLLEKDENGEVTLVCHSQEKEAKEQSMKRLLAGRFEQELTNLSEGLTKPNCTKKYDKVLQRLGRLKERYPISTHYTISVYKEGDLAKTITWSKKEQNLTNRYSGYYYLKIFNLDWTASQLWETYTMLTTVEESFRCLKSELGLRPIHHQIDHRIEGHIFISLLAYHLLQTVQHQLRGRGIHIRWETVRQVMSSQTRVTAAFKTDTGKTLRIRSSTIPSADQRTIYDALGLSTDPGGVIKTIL